MHHAVSPKGVHLFVKAWQPTYFLRTISTTSPNSASKFNKRKLTYYEILGIDKGASNVDIRKAFLKLSKDFHPDLNPDDPKNHDKFVEINEAYSVLIKPLARRDYDRDLLFGPKPRMKNYPGSPKASWNDPGSHYSKERTDYYDPQFYHYRDRSQDAYYASKPYYGIPGISKVSNKIIVYVCMGILFFGAGFHFFVVKKLSDIHIDNLNARDKKNHEIWQKANDPEHIKQQLQLMKIRIQEKEERKKSKDD